MTTTQTITVAASQIEAAGRGATQFWFPVEVPLVGDNGGKLLSISPTTIKGANGWDARYELDNPKFLGDPFPVGSALALRDKTCICPSGHFLNHDNSEMDDPPVHLGECSFNDIRYRFQIIGVEVKQPKDATTEDLIAAGVPDNYRYQFSGFIGDAHGGSAKSLWMSRKLLKHFNLPDTAWYWVVTVQNGGDS